MFSDGLAPVKVYDREYNAWTYIDVRGKEIMRPVFFRAEEFSDGYAVVGTGTTKKAGKRLSWIQKEV